MLNEITTIYQYFWRECDKRFVGPSGEVDIWRSIHPLIGHSIDESLALSEANLNYLMNLKAFKFLNVYHIAFLQYKSISFSITEYTSRHAILQSMTPAPDSMTGNLASHYLTKEQVLALLPYNIQLESLARSIRDSLAKNLTEIYDALDEFQTFFQSLTGKRPIDLEQASTSIKRAGIGKELPRT